MIDYKNKINIDYNNGTNLKENEIAIVVYCNVSDSDLMDFCNHIYYILFLGNWILRNKVISMHVVDRNLDILGLENKNAYNRAIYIKSEDLNQETIKVDNYRKMFDLNEIDQTIPSSGYTTDTISDFIVYGCYERKLDNDAKLNPYCSDYEDDTFSKIEEIFAKESYKKNLLKLYHIGSNNNLYAYSGFSYNIIMNNFIENDDIASILNKNFKTKLKTDVIRDYKKENHIDAIKEIYKLIYDANLTDSVIDELKKYLRDIENKLGSYIKLYSLEEEENDTDECDSINPFYINMGNWCVVYQNAILIVSYGSDE